MQSKKILVITPHPDDAESGAGGTIAKWSGQGSEITLVVCTNGNKGTSDRKISPDQLAKTRKKEQMKAAEILGIKEVVFLDYPDQGLTDSDDFRKIISLILLDFLGGLVKFCKKWIKINFLAKRLSLINFWKDFNP